MILILGCLPNEPLMRTSEHSGGRALADACDVRGNATSLSQTIP